MSKYSSVLVTKDEASSIIDWQELKFVDKNKKKPGVKTYSQIFHEKIFEKYGVKFYVGNGKRIGQKSATVFMVCPHANNFNLNCPRREFVEGADLEFIIERAKCKTICDCRE
jgi:hypothetical protein